MMKRTSKTQVCNITSGTIVIGKWHQYRYRIIRPLGKGASGNVYLATGLQGLIALKIGHESMSITSEVNILKKFSKVQGTVLGPSLIDVDDWVTSNGTQPFYVMEYLKGEALLPFLRTKSNEWLGILIVQLLADLDCLHCAGWVFGDLKPENLLVVGPPPRIRWLDVGGTTQLGRAVKEYTEFFDRGYWGLGSRKAEPSYDLFSAAMIMINAAYPKRFEKNVSLQQVVQRSTFLHQYRHVIVSALKGKYQTAPEMRQAIVAAMNSASQKIANKSSSRKKTAVSSKRTVTRQQGQTMSRQQRHTVHKKHEWLKTLLLATFIFTAYFLYLFGSVF